ncbi:serine hydrolase domain-containing protein [Sphingomonas lenta]|uniref:Serine hydrolase n=1 Tax=Sphingomonas lenta TaxID=1141887 RepID=A0A2A2SDI9_9SPHN|nr:serine hydrolase domain-containing protein [Sphingomonas lenta]PAX07317.1 serine hydrolase [Sphingomonas lenta]
MRATLTALALLLGTAPVAAQTPAAAADAQADRPAKTPGGSTFTAPKAWSLREAPRFAELGAPEGDLKIALVDVGPAPDAKAAVASAWTAYAPAMTRPPKLVTARPPRNGWDERHVVDYEVSPNEKRALFATALRAKDRWTVLLFDGAEATAEKRAAAANLVAQSLRPAGYTRESFAGRQAHAMTPERIAMLRSFVETSMRELGVPGASFAITDRNRTIYSAGLGVRELGRPEPVDADTQFMIASNTKGMATLLLAKLVDEGKLRWDQPVAQVYPDFKLGSPETTNSTLVRHLVCACTGLPRKDLQWLFTGTPKTPAADTFVQLAATQPTSGFGEVFQYNNLMATAAGYVGGHLAYPGTDVGTAFDRAMDEKVFRPLGMTATTFDFDRAMAGNWARPHAYNIDGRPVASVTEAMAFNRSIHPYRPAGGAWSTANDLIKYVRFELNEGKLDDGRQWVSKPNLLARRQPFVPTGEDSTYGMGLFTNSYWGVPVVHHGGSMGGYKSDIMLVPDAGVGAVILTNSDQGQMLLRPFMRRLLEILYDGKPEAAGDIAASAARIKAEYATERKKLTLPADPAAVAALAPAYVNPDLGRITVARGSDGRPSFRFASFGSPMATRRNDDGTTSFVTLEPTVLGFPFVVATEGGKRALIVRDSQHEYKFVEAP